MASWIKQRVDMRKLMLKKVLDEKLQEMEKTQTNRESAGGEDTEWAEVQCYRRNLCEILEEEPSEAELSEGERPSEADEVGLSEEEETGQAGQSEGAELTEEEKRTPLFLRTKQIVHKYLEQKDEQLNPSSASDDEEHNNHIIREAELIIERERLRQELKEVKARLKKEKKREKERERKRDMEREIERETAWEREKALETACLGRQRKVMMEMADREYHWKVEKERLTKIEKEQKKWTKQIKKRQRKIEKEMEKKT